jgi:hypothetical protein
MRKFIIAACLASVGCARGGASADSAAAAAPDSTAVPGQPAAPATQPSSDTAATPVPKRPPSPATSGRGATPPAPAARDDSVRGIVSVVGTSFEKRVMVAAAAQRRVEVTGPLSNLIGHVAGAEVIVAGAMSGTRIEARRFLVRSVDGQPAIDGTLRTEGGLLYIVTASGTRTRIVAPPPPLVGQDGARVWITGDPAKGVSSFGFIDPPR